MKRTNKGRRRGTAWCMREMMFARIGWGRFARAPRASVTFPWNFTHQMTSDSLLRLSITMPNFTVCSAILLASLLFASLLYGVPENCIPSIDKVYGQTVYTCVYPISAGNPKSNWDCNFRLYCTRYALTNMINPVDLERQNGSSNRIFYTFNGIFSRVWRRIMERLSNLNLLPHLQNWPGYRQDIELPVRKQNFRVNEMWNRFKWRVLNWRTFEQHVRVC